MAIAKAGIKKLLPEGIELISGPGCPVCVTSQEDIDRAIKIAGVKDVIMATFGDMMRVPGSLGSLEDIKRRGADVRIVYSCIDALDMAEKNPSKKVVFMGVGFETTSPTVAATVIEAKRRKARNFFVLSDFKLIFPALEAIAGSGRVGVDGFLCPGHVSVITGSVPYERIAKRYGKACVITGFDDADIIKGIKRLVDQIQRNESEVEIEYRRAVGKEGNVTAKKVLRAVFKPGPARWRGLGKIEKSGLKLRKTYERFDAEKEFKIKIPRPKPHKGCICGDVLQGIKSPVDCKLFGKKCDPRSPVGPCMVSSEGTCAAYFKYGA